VKGTAGVGTAADSAAGDTGTVKGAGPGAGSGAGSVPAAPRHPSVSHPQEDAGAAVAAGVPFVAGGYTQGTPKSPRLLEWAIQGAEEAEEEVALEKRLVAQRGEPPGKLPGSFLSGRKAPGSGDSWRVWGEQGHGAWMESHSGTENVMSAGELMEGSSSVGDSRASGSRTQELGLGPLRPATSGESEDDVAWEQQMQREALLSAAQEGEGESEVASIPVNAGSQKSQILAFQHRNGPGSISVGGGSWRYSGGSTPVKGAGATSADSSPSKRRAQWGPPQEVSQLARTSSLEEGQGSSSKASWTRRQDASWHASWRREGAGRGAPAAKALMFEHPVLDQRLKGYGGRSAGEQEGGEEGEGSTNEGVFQGEKGPHGGDDVSEGEAESGATSAAWGAPSAVEAYPMVAVQALGTAVLDVSGARKALGTPMKKGGVGMSEHSAAAAQRRAASDAPGTPMRNGGAGVREHEAEAGTVPWKARSGGHRHGYSDNRGYSDSVGGYSGWAPEESGAAEDEASAMGETRYGLHLDTDTEAESDVAGLPRQPAPRQRLALEEEEAEVEERVGESMRRASASSGAPRVFCRSWHRPIR